MPDQPSPTEYQREQLVTLDRLEDRLALLMHHLAAKASAAGDTAVPRTVTAAWSLLQGGFAVARQAIVPPASGFGARD